MKRILTLLLVVSFLALPATVKAQPLPDKSQLDIFNLGVQSQNEVLILIPAKPVEQPEPPKPVVYLVVAGDNLTKIGTKYNVEWQRLWAKNTNLKHPDLIHVGDKITIPEPSEQLSRKIPAAVSLPAKTAGVVPLRDYGGGNTYDYGYCTWYVKNRRGASLPNGLGDAHSWYSRAQAMGMAVGSTPRAGAVGTTTRGSLGHVVYVESVNKDGSINISEMNYKGFGVQSSRTASASEFVYIY
jgi:surface antigen